MRLPSENGQSAKKWRKTMKKGFFKKGTALAISAAMAVSMLPTLNPIEKVDAATTSESTKTITGLRIAGITNPRGSNGETLSDTEKWTEAMFTTVNITINQLDSGYWTTIPVRHLVLTMAVCC